MSSLKVNIPHKLSQQEALSRIKGLLQKLKQDQKDKISIVKEDWHGDTGTFQFIAQGFDLSGVINVQPYSIDINAKLPFAVSLFKGKIREVIIEKARELLS
jgi:Putative polyhydroxyalkanoic acid system protein (PHA_gran_rgn)